MPPQPSSRPVKAATLLCMCFQGLTHRPFGTAGFAVLAAAVRGAAAERGAAAVSGAAVRGAAAVLAAAVRGAAVADYGIAELAADGASDLLGGAGPAAAAAADDDFATTMAVCIA